MTDEQYWDGDCALVRSYREAETLRQERFNQQAWLQGMYIYDALGRIAPVLRPFSKKGSKVKPYPEEPYPITRQTAERAQQKQEQANAKKGLAYMQAYMASNNKRFQERK